MYQIRLSAEEYAAIQFAAGRYEIREQVHSELAPCSREEFLNRYLELDPDFSDGGRGERPSWEF